MQDLEASRQTGSDPASPHPFPGLTRVGNARLLAVAWWDWPADRIIRNLRALRGNDTAALREAA